MKKFIYPMLLLAVAGMTMSTFASCEEKEEDEVIKQEEVKKEDYLAVKYWVSDDMLEIADVKVNGLNVTLKFSKLTLDGCSGQACDLVELTGQQAKDAKFTVTLELKSNWKELVKDKDKVILADHHIINHEKGKDFSFTGVSLRSSTLDRDSHSGLTLEEQIEKTIPLKGFEYPD